VKVEQGFVQCAGLAGLHPHETGQQHFLEGLRFQAGDSELKQAANDDERGGMRVIGGPAFSRWQEVSGPGRQVYDRTFPQLDPGLPVR
jgi:hypothetical protein